MGREGDKKKKETGAIGEVTSKKVKEEEERRKQTRDYSTGWRERIMNDVI